MTRRYRAALAPVLALAGCGADPASSPSQSAAQAAPPSTTASQPMSQPTHAVASMGPERAAAATEGPLSCNAEIGARAAAALASQCRSVSPATHPPCNAANSCAMIRNEITRSCAVIEGDGTRVPECPLDPVSREAAADMVARYYAAINARDYAASWALWGEDGGTSGKTLDQFAAGFARTRRTHVDIGRVSDVEGAAGSLYVTVPVRIDAELDDGTRQRFTGSYTLRQVNRGMGRSQGWHIATAKLARG